MATSDRDRGTAVRPRAGGACQRVPGQHVAMPRRLTPLAGTPGA